MDLEQVFSGVVVAVTEKPYEFDDRVTGQTQSGISRRVWLVTSATQTPLELSLPANADGEKMAQQGRDMLGKAVVARCSLRARGNKVTATPLSIDLAEARPARAS